MSNILNSVSAAIQSSYRSSKSKLIQHKKKTQSPFDVLQSLENENKYNYTDTKEFEIKLDNELNTSKNIYESGEEAFRNIHKTLCNKYIGSITKNWKTVAPIRGVYEITELYNLVSTYGGMICGGYARYCASPLKTPVIPDDVDVFFPSKLLFDAFIKEELYSNNKDQEDGNYSTDYNLRLSSTESGTGYTYIPTDNSRFSHLRKIQFISPEYTGKDIYETLDKFDFSIVRAGFLDLNTIVVDEDFIEHENNLELKIRNIQSPVGTISRLMKYSINGYKVSPDEILKAFIAWEKLNLIDKVDLFQGIIIKDKYMEDESVNDTDYLKVSRWYYKLVKKLVGMDYNILVNTYQNRCSNILKYIPGVKFIR